jgi:hypothetical protein
MSRQATALSVCNKIMNFGKFLGQTTQCYTVIWLGTAWETQDISSEKLTNRPRKSLALNQAPHLENVWRSGGMTPLSWSLHEGEYVRLARPVKILSHFPLRSFVAAQCDDVQTFFRHALPTHNTFNSRLRWAEKSSYIACQYYILFFRLHTLTYAFISTFTATRFDLFKSSVCSNTLPTTCYIFAFALRNYKIMQFGIIKLADGESKYSNDRPVLEC